MIEEASVDIQVDPVLHKACAIDLVKFCRDIPRGEGRLFGCLVAVSDEARFSMEPKCKEKVTTHFNVVSVVSSNKLFRAGSVYSEQPSIVLLRNAIVYN